MSKLLLTAIFAAAAVTASAAPRQLLSITQEDYGSTYLTSFEYDNAGRLVKIVDGNTTLTFDYSQLDAKKLVLTRVDSNEWSTPDTSVYEMTLNDANLVAKWVETYNGVKDDDYCTFEYTDGYLTNFRQVSSDEVEETKISYVNGRIEKVENIDGSVSECSAITFEYGDIQNPGSLVLYDIIFDIDFDDIEYVAMTGMLGKIYTALPIKATETDVYGSKTNLFKWTVDDEGYATKVEITEENYSQPYSYSFAWSASSAVSAINADLKGTSRFFSIDGKSVASDAKGIVIERRADGSVIKRINR
ncbi:MAG: DUF4595 domain-containing protein [Muribaculum sp.]|nr:DUF4595 domain-containing protein [Muribaculum sp.]